MENDRKLEEQKLILFYPEVINAVNKCIDNTDQRYSSFNHFVRVAVVKLLREEGYQKLIM